MGGFSFSLATGQSPAVEVDPNGQVSSPFAAFSIQAIANKMGGTTQGTPATGRIQEPALIKGAPVPSPWAWMQARPLVVVSGLVALLALLWIAKRKG